MSGHDPRIIGHDARMAPYCSMLMLCISIHPNGYLLTRSEGTIGELAHLLMAAAITAVESGEEAINHRTLSMADYTGPSERRRQFERELM